LTPVNTGYQPTQEELMKAEKYSRFATSALQFEDVPTAIKNLTIALRILTGQPIDDLTRK
jgi:vacuolar protein sorting-associated protein VTA1